MIPYELIVPSASRPHLLKTALRSLLEHVDQLPTKLHVHDDTVFPGKEALIDAILLELAGEFRLPGWSGRDSPPIGHGPTLYHLLNQVGEPYVLYTQDDLEVVRPLPIARALGIMEEHEIHQIRFNKRPTAEYKGEWRKKEFPFTYSTGAYAIDRGPLDPLAVKLYTHRADDPIVDIQPLTVADHWYFQTGLWRVQRIKSVVDWFMETQGAFHEHPEPKVNRAMNRNIPEFTEWALQHNYQLPAAEESWSDPDVRARVQRTFIWGPIGEPQYVSNLGADPKDWAHRRPRGGQGGPADSQAGE